MIRILLVDDQTLVRQGIQTLLDLEEDLTVVGAAANGQQALAMVEQLQPDVVLMDVRMPVMEGVAATREITKRWPHIGVIILTTFDDDEICDRGLKSRRARVYAERCRQQRDCRSGADCGPRRGIDPAEHHPQSAGRVHPAGRWQGASNAAVGRTAHRARDGRAAQDCRRAVEPRDRRSTLRTVKNHVSNLRAKLAVRHRTQAIIRARELGLIE